MQYILKGDLNYQKAADAQSVVIEMKNTLEAMQGVAAASGNEDLITLMDSIYNNNHNGLSDAVNILGMLRFSLKKENTKEIAE